METELAVSVVVGLRCSATRFGRAVVDAMFLKRSMRGEAGREGERERRSGVKLTVKGTCQSMATTELEAQCNRE